jgi:hypothetical protein
MRHPRVALDFDGTLVTHQYPDIGRDIGAIYHLNRIKDKYPDVCYILWTVRSGLELRQAVFYCELNGIKLWGVNENPTQRTWSASPKAHADIYVDDAALGTPRISFTGEGRPCVDWRKIGPSLMAEIDHYYKNDSRAQ